MRFVICCRNGLVLRSAPMVVAGPWPGMTSVSSGKSQQTGLDGFDDLVEVAAGQVGAPDAAGEERVAGDDHLERREVEAEEPWVWPGVWRTWAG